MGVFSSVDGARRTPGVVDAVLLDPALNERQKRVLLDVYDSFVRENTPETAETPSAVQAEPAAEAAPAKKPAAKKTPARKSTTK